MQREAVSQLQRHLKAVLSKRPGQAVGLWGEPGVGKTFTVQTLLSQAPCQSLSLHATVHDNALVLSLPRPPKRPTWTHALHERLTQGQHVETQALLDILITTLSALAPFVLHLEDIHEASPERLELLQKLAKAIPRLRGVGLLVTSRSQPPEPFKGYHLKPLSQAQLDELLEGQVKATLPREGLAWVFERTGGNPLYGLEFWRYLRQQGFFWSDGKEWHWRKPPDDFVPVSVEALIAQIASRLETPGAAAILQVRAMFPNEMSLEDFDPLWARVADISLEALNQGKKALQRQGLLQNDQFAHPLFREVVGRETPQQDKQSYALRALEALEAAQPELAAVFVEASGIPAQKAIDLLERAAERAQGLGNLKESGQLLAQATRFASGETRGRLALAAERALRRVGSIETCIGLLEMALADLPPDPDTIIALAGVYTSAGRLEQADKLVKELLASEQPQDWLEQQIVLLQRMGKTPEALQVWEAHPEIHSSIRTNLMLARSVAHLYSDHGRQDQAWEVVQQALEQDSSDTYNRICLLDKACSIKERLFDIRSAKTYFEGALELAKSYGDPDLLAMVLSNGSSVLRGLGQYKQMVENLEQALSLYAKAGRALAYHNTAVMLSWALIELGQYERAEALLQGAFEYFQHSGSNALGIVCLVRLRHLYLDWNPPHGPSLARKYAYLALERGRANPNPIALANGLIAVALCEATVGSAERALETAQEGLGVLSRLQAPGLEVYMRLSQGMALARLGHKAEAMAAFGKALELQGGEWSLEGQKIQLQIDRLNQDRRGAKERLAWFEQRGLVNGANLVRRYFPDLGVTVTPVQSTQNALTLKVLGSVGLEQSGQPIAYRGKKRLELLCYLLEARIAGREEVSVLELVDAFYSDVDEAKAKGTLKQQVHLIRMTLGQNVIQSTFSGYALGAIRSDAEAFLQSGDETLWRGAYLENLSEGWYGGVREALVQALYSKARGLQHNPTEAARLGQILMEMEPYDAEFLQLSLQAIQPENPKMAARLYKEAQERFAGVGEALPFKLEDFLPAVSVNH